MPKGGQNKKKWTEQDLKRIATMAGLGLSHEHMASLLGCSSDTIARHLAADKVFAAEVLKGKAVAASRVMQTAFQMAVSGKSAAMTAFWLKCREGWNSQESVTVTVNDDLKILEKYSDATREELINAARGAIAAS